jgi:hypothetical protein
MKRLALAICLLVHPVVVTPQAQAAEFDLSGVIEWTDQITQVLRDLDDRDEAAHRADRDWTSRPIAEDRGWLRWRRGDTEMRPWLRMHPEGAGAGLLLEF